MSGMVDRRNDRIWWAGKVTWSRVTAKNRAMCEDCLLNVHANGGTESRIPRARHRRKVTYGDTTVFGQEAFRSMYLCDVHKQEWLDWTPGQMVMPT